MNVEIQSAEQVAEVVPETPRLADLKFQHADFDPQAVIAGGDPEALALAAQQPIGEEDSANEAASAATVRRTEAKVGRNDPCPCGSGKKYKHCHGMLK